MPAKSGLVFGPVYQLAKADNAVPSKRERWRRKPAAGLLPDIFKTELKEFSAVTLGGTSQQLLALAELIRRYGERPGMGS